MKFYVAGPMTGYKQFNFEAFDDARDFLTLAGHTVFSPADHDREVGVFEHTTNSEITPEQIDEMIAWDIGAITRADALYMLQGWELSKGAKAEHALAVWMGKKIYYENCICEAQLEENETDGRHIRS